MVMCSIMQCGSRKSVHHPNLTLHCLPRNEIKRKKWLEAIGLENINPRHKKNLICSLHFEESQFNKTLDVVRLREDAVPSVFKPKSSASATDDDVTILLVNEEVIPKNRPVKKKLIPSVKQPSSECETSFLEEETHPSEEESAKEDPLSPADQPSSECETSFLEEETHPSEEESAKEDPLSPADQPSSTRGFTELTSSASNRGYIQLTSSPSDQGHWQLTSSPSNRGYFQLTSSPDRRSVLQGPTLKTAPARKKLIPMLSAPASNRHYFQVSSPNRGLRARAKIGPESIRLKRLEIICAEQRKKIKRLHETVRRQVKHIESLKKNLQDQDPKQKSVIRQTIVPV